MTRLGVLGVLVLAGAVASPASYAQFESAPPDFIAALSGEHEVPPRATSASGSARFRLINLGATLAYEVRVDGLVNLVAGHIHLAPAGTNGSIVVGLVPNMSPGGGLVDGLVAAGTIESSDLTGPLAGQSLSVLLEAMRTGGAYVNLHTNDGVDPSNTGAGDFPGGEIRGQIKQTRDRAQYPREIDE